MLASLQLVGVTSSLRVQVIPGVALLKDVLKETSKALSKEAQQQVAAQQRWTEPEEIHLGHPMGYWNQTGNQ